MIRCLDTRVPGHAIALMHGKYTLDSIFFSLFFNYFFLIVFLIILLIIFCLIFFFNVFFFCSSLFFFLLYCFFCQLYFFCCSPFAFIYLFIFLRYQNGIGISFILFFLSLTHIFPRLICVMLNKFS